MTKKYMSTPSISVAGLVMVFFGLAILSINCNNDDFWLYAVGGFLIGTLIAHISSKKWSANEIDLVTFFFFVTMSIVSFKLNRSGHEWFSEGPPYQYIVLGTLAAVGALFAGLKIALHCVATLEVWNKPLK